jgi:hypothetical protein
MSEQQPDYHAPAIYDAVFPALTGAAVVGVAALLWALLSGLVLPEGAAALRRAVLLALSLATAVLDFFAVRRVTRLAIERKLMPASVSPSRCAFFIVLAGATIFLLPFLPTVYDTRTRQVSGPQGVIVVAAHLAMGWLGTRSSAGRQS